MEARSMARGIFPVHVDHTGLSIALSELAQNTQRLTGIAINVDDVADVQIEALRWPCTFIASLRKR